MKVIVYHDYYGCDTGCCGHTVELANGDRSFEFDHAYGEDPRVFAERLVRDAFGDEHVKDLDWDNCRIEEG